MDSKAYEEYIQNDVAHAEREHLVLQRLLDTRVERRGHIIALKARMGITRSYVSTVPLSWVANHVKFAAELPLFGQATGSTTVKINPHTARLLRQRQPDWRRQLSMSAYLAGRINHKFPPILVVGYDDWTCDMADDNWLIDKRAMETSPFTVSFDSNGYILDLVNQATKFYALDGQHRLMAIIGLRELLQKGQLVACDRDGRPQKEKITLDEVIERRAQDEKNQGRTPDKTKILSALQNQMNEFIGIEIIPAVQRGEMQEEAIMRLSQIFTDVNEPNRPSAADGNILPDDEPFPQ